MIPCNNLTVRNPAINFDFSLHHPIISCQCYFKTLQLCLLFSTPTTDQVQIFISYAVCYNGLLNGFVISNIVPVESIFQLLYNLTKMKIWTSHFLFKILWWFTSYRIRSKLNKIFYKASQNFFPAAPYGTLKFQSPKTACNSKHTQKFSLSF